MKEIGIRSSRLETGDGAEVIIPNGDLISQNVVNWTLSNTSRQVELVVRAAYGSDIEKVTSLLQETMAKRDDIMDNPGPSVFLLNVSEDAVDFRVLFWAADISHYSQLRSRVLADIYAGFAKEGIAIPKKKKE
jgi:small-conductance mechanosensitive channel